MQVLSCSLSACTLVPFVTFCLLIELFCFLVAVLFLSRISNIKIQLLNDFTGHQSANTTKIRRVQKFKWEGEVLAEGIRSNENWKGLSICRHTHFLYTFAIFVLGRSSFDSNFCWLLRTYTGKLIIFVYKWLQMVHHTWYLVVPHDYFSEQRSVPECNLAHNHNPLGLNKSVFNSLPVCQYFLEKPYA